jgi:D-alanyl-D-alanine carboxypeptidase (penicillin-binding protein 5/6)
MDASTGRILYAKNPNLRLPPASTTKLMTAMVVMDNTNFTDTITISRNASRVSPLKAGLKKGDKVTVGTLLYAALMESANDATVALAEAVAGSETKFVQMMNKKALAIGARDTKFINSNGLPGRSQYTTALDLSKIMRHALKYPKLKEIIGTRVAKVSTENGNPIFLKNTNRLLWSYENLIGGKTGYTRKARHCIVCAAGDEGNTVVVTLLGSPSREELWKEAGELIDKGFQIIANKEEPAIYLTKVKEKNNKAKVTKVSSKKRSTKTVVKKRSLTKTSAKNGKEKKYETVKKGENGNKG